ncbi:MAG: hypothetical protein WCH86_03115 [Kiritimatiellales bacterium]
MKRLFLLTVFLMAGIVAQAAPAPKTPMNLEAYLAKQKANAEKKGTEFDEAKAKEAFAKKDLDKNGILSVEEQAPAPKKEKAE